MNRRAAVAAVVGVLLLVAWTAVWSASADMPEPLNGFTTVNVTLSDDLPPSGFSAVVVEGYYSEGTVPIDVVASECIPALMSCGAPTPPLGPTTVFGEFTGTIPLFRYLTFGSKTYDCTVDVCTVEVTVGVTRVASHHLTFSKLVPTTTTLPPSTTSSTVRVTTTSTVPPPTTTTTRAPQPGVFIPPTTRVTVPRTTTTRPSPTTTTVAPTTTTTLPPPPPGPTLIAVTTTNEPAGPPGGALRVEGTGYTCPTVYFFFDGARVGSDEPDRAGNVSASGLSVPGDTGKGRRRVTSSCEPSGGVVQQASVFEVLPVAVHRPAFVTSLPRPDQVSVDPGKLLASAAIAIAAIMLIAFPYELFNSTMEENYDEIRGWFGLGPRGVRGVKTRSRLWGFFALTAVASLACGFLSPDFGLNRTSVVLFLGIFAGFMVMSVLFSVPADLGIRRQFGEWGKLNFLPGTLIVTILMVATCRLFNFQPGYFYGALAGLAFRSALSEEVQGKFTAANWLFSLVVSVGAFFLRAPVSSMAARPGSSIWWIGLEICLSLIFLWGVEGLAVAMLPMRFLDGRKIFRWSRTAWAALFFLGVFATVHVLLRPGSGYVGSTTGDVGIGVMTMFAVFGLISVGLWAYFRFRPERWARVRA